MWRGLLLLGLLLISCADSEPVAPAVEPVVGAAPELPSVVAEDPRDQRGRLLRLEHACDQWYAAWLQQEFARMASLELLLRDATARDFEAVVSDLRTGSPRHKRVMSAALGFSGRAEAVPALLAATEEQYYEIVLHALFSLYRLCDKRNPETATAAAAQIDPERMVAYLAHPRPEVRSNAALVLSRIVKPDSAKPVLLALIALADDAEPRVRVHAMAALAAARCVEAFPQMVKALGDSFELVRVRAALGLGSLGNAEAVPYLIEILAKPEEARVVRQAASRALGVLLHRPDEHSEDPEFWRQLQRAAKG